MSASLSKAAQPELTPILGTALLLPLLAAAIFPFDDVLAGMIAAGHGVEALCAFLDLTQASLFEHVTRLGLATPHARPLRAPGPRGWANEDVRALIAWRCAGVHPEVIAARLGRSASGVRAKCRRLGLKAPPRKALHRPNPETLTLPERGYAFRRREAPSPVSASARGQAQGAACGAGTQPNTVIHLRPHASGAVAHVGQAGEGAAQQIRGRPAQGEMPLLRMFRAPAALSALPISPAAPSPRAPLSNPEAPESSPSRSRRNAPRPRHQPVERSRTDLTWLNKLRNLRRDKELVLLLSLRYFGRQTYTAAAAAFGMTEKKLATLYDRFELPRDYDRRKFSAEYDKKLAHENLARCEYELVLCAATKAWWWRHKVTERYQRYSREGARLLGMPRERETRRMCV